MVDQSVEDFGQWFCLPGVESDEVVGIDHVMGHIAALHGVRRPLAQSRVGRGGVEMSDQANGGGQRHDRSISRLAGRVAPV